MHFVVPKMINNFALTQENFMTFKTLNIYVLPRDYFVVFLHSLSQENTDLIL